MTVRVEQAAPLLVLPELSVARTHTWWLPAVAGAMSVEVTASVFSPNPPSTADMDVHEPLPSRFCAADTATPSVAVDVTVTVAPGMTGLGDRPGFVTLGAVLSPGAVGVGGPGVGVGGAGVGGGASTQPGYRKAPIRVLWFRLR